MPLFLAGREQEKQEFARLLTQDTIFENLVLTGLRGVGKTVLLESLKPLAIQEGWLWVGTDLSEAASLSEDSLALRLIADLAVVTSSLVIAAPATRPAGFTPAKKRPVVLDFQTLSAKYAHTPGLVADKLKAVLELVWLAVRARKRRGIVFAYDEAQNMSDHASKEQYPLSLMLDVFQSLQRKEIPFLLALAGLPTLYPKLVEARTFSERMFHVLTLDRLGEQDSQDAILKPLAGARSTVRFSPPAIQAIIAASGGYPYFLQFICRELFDAFLQSGKLAPVADAIRKLDADFFLGRWSRTSDRQRQLLWVVANLEHSDGEFSAQEVAERTRDLLTKEIGPSQIIQMFRKLSMTGMIYRNRHGRYSFAVPLLGPFILRQPPPPEAIGGDA